MIDNIDDVEHVLRVSRDIHKKYKKTTSRVVLPVSPVLENNHYPPPPSPTAGRWCSFLKVSLKIEPHATFTREGPNLLADLPISLTEALSGFTREILLLNGTVVPLNKTGVS